jgi:outer membrane protein assembly factor BamB
VAEPSAVDDLVFVAGYYEPLVAIERSTKKVRWTLPHGAAAGALLGGKGDKAVLFHPGTDGTLRAVAAKSGDVLWAWESGSSGALSSPVWTPAGIMVGSSNSTVTLLEARTGEVLWTFKPPFLLEGVTSAPAVDGRQMLFVSNAGRIYSVISPKVSGDATSTGLASRGANARAPKKPRAKKKAKLAEVPVEAAEQE